MQNIILFIEIILYKKNRPVQNYNLNYEFYI